MTYRLQEHSSILLRKIFVFIATFRSGSTIYPLCHPIHSNYLVTLHHTCCQPPANSTRSRFSDYSFTCMLVDTLTDTAKGVADLWTCKAMTRFARDIYRSDFTAYMYLCSGAMQNIPICKPSTVPKKRSRHKHFSYERGPPPDHRLPDQLVAWLSEILPCLIDTSGHHTEDFLAVLSFLKDTTSTHSFHIQPPQVADAILCLSTLCFRPTFYSSLPADEKEHLKSILHQVHVRSETYDKLILSVLSGGSHTPSSSRCQTPLRHVSRNVILCSTAIDTIREIARPLRARAFHRLEASLWSSTLRNVEVTFIHSGTVTAGIGSSREMDALRRELVERVERAERRCFGAGRSSQGGIAPQDVVEVEARPESMAVSDGEEWEWEDMVGTWVRKTPMAVKTSLIAAASAQDTSKKKRKFREEKGSFGGGSQICTEASRRTSIPEYFMSSRYPYRSSGVETTRKGDTNFSLRDGLRDGVAEDLGKTRLESRGILHESKIANALRNVEVLHPHPRHQQAQTSEIQTQTQQQQPQPRRSLASLFPQEFDSKLARSLMNVEVLHPPKRPVPAQPAARSYSRTRTQLDSDEDEDSCHDDGDETSDESTMYDSDTSPTSTARSNATRLTSRSASTTRTVKEEDFGCGVTSFDQLSSEDTLNLFAYGSEV